MMQQRALDQNGDYTMGLDVPFLANSPLCVAQAVLTRLKLEVGEWFIDLSDGLDLNLIVGTNTIQTRDLAVRGRILDTPGVLAISGYISQVNAKRQFSVVATLDTIYGSTQLATTI